MTTRHPHHEPLDGALVRVAVTGDAWAEGIPPVPAGSDITVTFSDAEAALVHGDALALLGYRVVGVQPHAAAPHPVADLLVPQWILERHPTWWRALADQSERAFSLALGPVVASLSEVLRAHLEPVRETA
jgi:hypothetical protein